MKLNNVKKQLFIILLIASVITKAQTKTDSNNTEPEQQITKFSKVKRHAISLDVFTGLFSSAFNPRYEYTFNKYSSVGADLNINIEDSGLEVFEKFSFSPFYRQYFFSKKDYGTKGFYAEGFLKFYTFESESNSSSLDFSSTNTQSFFETAIGVGLGKKWVSDSGFIIDINFGLGRNLGFSDAAVDLPIVGKFGINFGWQF